MASCSGFETAFCLGTKRTPDPAAPAPAGFTRLPSLRGRGPTAAAAAAAVSFAGLGLAGADEPIRMLSFRCSATATAATCLKLNPLRAFQSLSSASFCRILSASPQAPSFSGPRGGRCRQGSLLQDATLVDCRTAGTVSQGHLRLRPKQHPIGERTCEGRWDRHCMLDFLDPPIQHLSSRES